MTQPAVNITELDGALGVLPPSSGRLYAVVGPCASGTANVPATYARSRDLATNYTGGPAPEAAAFFVEKYGKPVVIVPTAASVVTVLESDNLVLHVAGTSVVTLDETTSGNDDYEAYVKIVAGGTRGTTGITYQWSLDGGRNLSPVTALGTATSITLPGTGGAKILLAAGTLVAGDTIAFPIVAPCWSSAELTTALTALRNSSVAWEILHVVGPIDTTAFDAIEVAMAGMVSRGKYRGWIGNVRMPSVGESEATYLAAESAAFSAKATVYGSLCAGACKLTSALSGRKYRRPVSYPVGALTANVSEEINVAAVNVGQLAGVSIRDANGNPDEHDESVNPGLDDARFCVLRTIEGYEGVYVNRPRLLSPAGSDFQLMPHRRVINLAEDALRLYFIRRLNSPIQVDKKTGYILESVALEIESGARAAMRDVLEAKPKASGIEFSLSRVDNIISTKTLTGDGRVIPDGYPEAINIGVGFKNPALQIQSV